MRPARRQAEHDGGLLSRDVERKGICLVMTGNRKGIYFITLCLILLLMPCKAQAALRHGSACSSMPPHLIQTVTQQEIYEGMLSLGMLQCPVLQRADCEKAFENVKDCVVRVNMGNAYGSGVLWDMTAERVVIVTNRHVLDYWRERDSFLYFQQGYYMDADILGISERYDIGFLSVDNGQFTYDELERLRSAAKDLAVYERLEQGSEMFCVGAGPGPEVGEILFHKAKLEERARYLADFETEMLYGYGFVRTGMSGGGIFDGYGHLIGMVTGGSLQNEVAGVPLPAMVEAYREITDPAE